jgi:hypothetical protein
MSKRFISGFDMTSEFEIDGERYKVRYGFHHTITREDYRPTVRALVGTVTHASSSRFHGFPAAAIVAEFPGFVGARFTDDWKVEYAGPRPTVVSIGDATTEMVEWWAIETKSPIANTEADMTTKRAELIRRLGLAQQGRYQDISTVAHYLGDEALEAHVERYVLINARAHLLDPSASSR